MSHVSWLRIYHLALRVLPEELRRKHGSAMLALFAREHSRARERGRLRGALAAATGVWDVVRRGIYERARHSVRMMRDRKASRGAHERHRGSSMDALRQDLVYSLRSLLRAPGFTAMVVLTLALGIGANSAIFGVVDAVLLRPLPFPDAQRVVNVAWDGSGYLQRLSSLKFQYWHDNARSFDAMATWESTSARIDMQGDVSVVRTLGVSRDFLDVLGFTPAPGRSFVAAEHASGGPRVAVISQAMSRTHFGGAADVGAVDVVGRTIRLDGEPFTVVGVLPEAFAFPYEDGRVDVLVPLRLSVDPADIAEDWPTIARLAEGVTREQAQNDVASLTEPFRSAYPDHVSEQDRGMTLATFSELYVVASVQRALWILMGAVALVLLIACANVANMFLARASRRRGEIALRAALGATRARITRLVLTESLLVAVAAGAFGLLLGRWVANTLVALAPTQVPRMSDVGIDWRVMLFTTAASLVTVLLFGGAAAWPASRAGLSEVLKQSTRGGSGGKRVRQGLLIAQSALSVVLLVGAGLLVATLIRLSQVDAGFDPDSLVAVRIASKPAGYETSQDLWQFERRVLQQVEGSTSIASIAGASSLPFERGINTRMAISGRPDVVGTVEWRAVTPGYFRTLGITLVAGRTFDDIDGDGGPSVAIVNESFARAYFPGESAIGHRIEVGRSRGGVIDPSVDGAVAEIVGIVGDIREVSLRSEPRRTMYMPQAQAPTYLSSVSRAMPVFIARGRSAGGDIERTILSAMRAADPALPRLQVFPLADVMTRSLARERFGATLLSALAALALTLTAFGIYGVLAYTVQQRRREIQIRMALGGRGRQVRRLVMVQGIGPVLVGLILGLLASLALARLLVAFLWGVPPADPGTFATVAMILLGVAFVASWIPAREAANMNPANTLNSVD